MSKRTRPNIGRKQAVFGAAFTLVAALAPVLPSAAPAGAVSDVEEFAVPTASATNYKVTAGPDGNLWFTEYDGNKIGMITPAGVITEYSIPTASSQPFGITTGPDGNIWFAEYAANKVGRLKPSDGTITEFSGFATDAGVYGITTGPDGNLWVTEANDAGRAIAKVTTAGVITEYTTSDIGCSDPYDITSGPDGKLWFTTIGCGFYGVSIGSMTTAGVAKREAFPGPAADPLGIITGPDGALWFAENGRSAIGRVTTGGAFTEFPTPTASSSPVNLALGADGNVWFTEIGANQIGRITPDGFVTEYQLPANSGPYGMAKGSDDRLWFTEVTSNKIGAIVDTATPLPALNQIDPTNGPSTGGTFITITGESLSGATAVKFGTVDAASFSADSDTQVTAFSPALSGGYYDVTVVTPNGTTKAVPRGKFLSLAPLKITAISPTEGDPDGGVSVTVFGSGFSSASAVTFGSDPASDFRVASDTQINATSPPQADHTVVNIRVTTVAGISPAVQADLFTYLARPVIDSVSPQWAPTSGGTTVTLVGKRFTGATAVHFGTDTVTCPERCQVIGDGQLEVVTPPHAVAGVPVTVTTPDGTSFTAPMFAFTSDGTYSPTGSCSPSCGFGGLSVLPDGKVLALGSDYTAPVRAHVYDPLTGTWTTKSQCDGCAFFGESVLLPQGPASACGSNCGKALYLPNGKLYDPATDTWSNTAPPPINSFANQPALMPNGKVLVVAADQAALYDPAADSWTMTGPLAKNHRSGTTTLLDNGTVLVTGGGGAGAPSRPPRVVEAEIYDPATNAWTLTDSLFQGRLAHNAVKLKNGKVLVTGGTVTYDLATSLAELYDPGTGEWSPFQSPIFARNSHDGTLLPDGRVLLSGGDEQFYGSALDASRGNNPSIGEVLDPATSKWTPAGPSLMLEDRGQNNQQHTARAVLLPAGPLSACGTHCGQVLVVRGKDVGYLDNMTLTPSAVLFAPSPRAALAPATGTTAGGTSVILIGTGLASVSSVSFGGVPATSVTPDPTTPDTKVTVVTPARTAGAVDVAVTTAGGAVVAGKFTYQTPSAPAVVVPAPTPATTPAPVVNVLPTTVLSLSGYTLAAADGGVFNFGTLPFVGSLGGAKPTGPIVAIEHTPTGKGYWLAGSDGGVYAFGDAAFKGSTGGIKLAKPIVDIVGTPSGAGYWLIGSDGGVFAFGDAVFKGSAGAIRLNSPVVAAERSITGKGYWLTAADGGVFAFGDAPFKGSTGSIRLAQPVVSLTRSPAGAGYWLIAADGGVFAFGDAVFHGSAGGIKLNSPIVGSAPAAAGSGYVLCAKDGGAFAFGSAGFAGSMGGSRLNSPITSCSGPRSSAT